MKDVITLVPALLAAAALLACDQSPVAQMGDPQLTLASDSVVVDVGASALVAATVINTTDAPQYVSRDQNVATVNASGAISGVAIGSTYVVATLPSAANVRDSVRVRVKTPPVFVDPCPLTRPAFGVATAEDRALFAYDVNAPLNLQKTVQASNSTFTLSGITYTSPAGGSVTGILVEPVGRSGLRPGMVILHPSGTPAQGMAGYGQQLAAHGAVVIVINAPYFRRGGTSALLFTGQDRDEHIQLIQDLQRAVDVLLARSDVDPARIAFEGYSYGGIIGAGFVGIERRLKAAVLAAAMGGHVTGATTPANLPFFASQSCEKRSAWFQNMIPLESIRYISNAPPTALLFQAGREDTAVRPQDTQLLYDAARDPKEILWYDTGHGLNEQALHDRHDWLQQQIGIDARATP